MFKISKLLLIISALVLTSCADSVNKNFKDNDNKQISDMLVKGRTTKGEVKSLFGQPTDIDFDNDNREKWTYSYAEAGKNPLNYLPPVSMLFGQKGKVRKMVIVFNNDVVYEYALSTDNERIKKGILTE
jgi:hypothetical protein